MTSISRSAAGITLALALSLSSAGPAGADPAADKKKAKELFNRAETQYRQGDFSTALQNYKAALELWRHTSIVFNIAQCHRQLKQLDKALFFYKLYLSDWERDHPGTRPPFHEEVQVHIARLTEEIKAREAAAQQEAKAREAAARQEAKTREERARLERARLERARLERQKRAPKPPATGRLRVEGPRVAQARIKVDGEPRGIAPLPGPLELAPGKHQVQVEAQGYLPWTRDVEVAAGQEASVQVSLRPVPGRSTFWLVTTLASVALAGGAEALAIVYTNKANEHYTDSKRYDEDMRGVIAGHTLAAIFGAASVTSFILYLRSGRVDQESAASGSLVPLPGGVAAAARLRF